MYDLDSFRKRIATLYRAADPFPDHHRPTQQDLAREVGLASAELSRRLHGTRESRLSAANIHAIVRTLARWQAITTQAEALDLLSLLDMRPFDADEWQQPPLDQLTALDQVEQAHFDHPSDNLPAPISSFVGRAAELATGTALLAANRLLTIVGAGGIGKTRFALALAAQLRGQFKDGIWLVELAAVSEPQELVRRVAAVLGVREAAGVEITPALIEYLHPRHVLLILDNCEHLLEASASLAASLLRSCPLLTVLATSREALGVSGEAELPLPPLSLPPAITAPLQIEESAAVQLFVQRARAAQPRFHLTADNAPVIADICRRLDGMPLAIELAAPLVKALTVEKISQRLDDSFRLLRASDHTADQRHQTLRACIEWSYGLLSEPQRTLLRRLAVFAGGWTLEAAEVVCAAGEPANEPAYPNSKIHNLKSEDVLEGHVQLVQKSLLLAQMHGGEMRYGMLEMIRQYAAERLATSGEAHQLRQAHANLYLALAERAARNLHGPEQLQWLDQLENEHDNLRAALDWAVREQQTSIALRLCIALWLFWRWRSHYSEGHQWLTLALSLPGEEETITRARALKCAGDFAWLADHDYVTAERLLNQALAIHRKLGNMKGISAALTNLGLIAKIQGDTAQAITRFEESLSIDQQLGDKGGVASGYLNLGEVSYNIGGYDAAEACFHQALTIFREFQDDDGISITLLGLGDVAYDRGDYQAARNLYQQSLDLAEQLQSNRRVSSRLALANVDFMEGDYASAYARYLEVFDDRISEAVGRGYALMGMGITLAALATDDATASRAANLLASASTQLTALEVALDRNMKRNRDAAAATLRRLLDDERFAAAWQQGTLMSAVQAAVLVISPSDMPAPVH